MSGATNGENCKIHNLRSCDDRGIVDAIGTCFRKVSTDNRLTIWPALDLRILNIKRKMQE